MVRWEISRSGLERFRQADQPLMEIREGDWYFCLEQRLVTVRN